MTVRSDKGATSGAPNRTALLSLIAVAVLLAIVAAWFYGANRGTAGTATPQQRADQGWVKQKAQESGGDFARLSAADQEKLTALYGKQAPNVLKGNAASATADY